MRHFTPFVIATAMSLCLLHAKAQTASRNLAPLATPTAFYTSSWTSLSAVNDGEYHFTGDVKAYYWGTWSDSRPATGWLAYEWASAYTFTGCKIGFWTDRDGDNIGDNVPLPASYKVQYWDGSDWADVTLAPGSSYTRNRLSANEFSFDEVTTSKLRLWLNASTNGSTYGAFGLTEWEALGYSEEPSLTLGGSQAVLSWNRQYRKAEVTVTAMNTGGQQATATLGRELAGLTVSPAMLTADELAAGATITLTFNPEAEGAKTDWTVLTVAAGETKATMTVMTSMDEGFEEAPGDMVYDPCFYSFNHVYLWETKAQIATIADGADVKCGATCVKFTGRSGIEYRGNMAWSPGEYVMTGWIKTNGTFECGVWGDCNFTSADSNTAEQKGGGSVNFLLPDTEGQWQQFRQTFTVHTAAVGGAWVNNDRSKTSTETYLDNLQIYKADAPCTDLTTLDGDYSISPVAFADVHFDDLFWTPRMMQNQQVSIPYFLQKCEDAGRMLNFRRADAIYHRHDTSLGYYKSDFTFDDTDLYKVLEGMSYSYQVNPTEEMDSKMDELIALIGSAQEDDGYLYTARTAGQPGNYHSWVGAQRWVADPNLSHELYNCGHLYEAAYAHHIATGKTSLLDIATKNADLLVHDFLDGGLTYEPGHQIVEMGLVKLYRITRKAEYLELAKYFLDLRGDKGEARSAYSQTHLPVIYQDEAVGHAVRAAYMYSGMVDVGTIGGVEPYLTAAGSIWDNVVSKKLYINGGIGALHSGESFGADYELPNQTAYNETCAAIANIYWNYRQFLNSGDSKYYDVLERTLYNNVVSAIGMNGNTYFYPNPLAADGKYHFNNDNTIGRQGWFTCTCCLSSLTRFLPSVPGYMYAVGGAAAEGHAPQTPQIYVNLFAQSTAGISLPGGKRVTLTQETAYPWEGKVTVAAAMEAPAAYALCIRIPGWARRQPVPSDLYSYADTDEGYTVSVNGTPVNVAPDAKGYAVISREWKDGDKVEVTFDMSPHRVVANGSVTADAGRMAFERGPLVYCIESPDNGGHDVYTAAVHPETDINVVEGSAISVAAASDNRLTKLTKLTMPGVITADGTEVETTLTAIPYYAWANRGDATTMEVWVRTDGSISTGIMQTLGNTQTEKAAATYNLMGQRVAGGAKGLVIRNGKITVGGK